MPSSALRDCGQRVIPSIIDERARERHARPIASIPSSPTSYRDVSYWEFANAVNRCTHWLLREVGTSHTFDTLAYLGPNDLRYQILIVAAIKSGHVLFVPSPRNSEEVFHALFDQSHPKAFLTTSKAPPVAQSISRARPSLRNVTVPDLDDLLDSAPVEPVEYRKSWAQCRYDPFVILHTSGSTGIPKLVTLRHGSFSAVDAMQMLPNNELATRFPNMRVLCFFPGFHVAGLMYTLAAPCFVDNTTVLPQPGLVTAEQVNKAHVNASVEFTLLPPAIILDLAKNDEHFENLCKMNGVFFAGGPLPESIGRRIADRTTLHTGIGSTEFIILPQLRKNAEDWAYFKFDGEGGGLEFREANDGLFEMVVVRRPELDKVQPVFVTFPDLHEFPTKDLYEKHPSKPNLWKYRGRLDDIIVFNNGEKLNPVDMEGIITSCPAVKGCLIVGQGRFQAAALIEPADTSRDKETLASDVWPYIQKANASTVKHGRVLQDLVFFATVDKPLPRAGKGTIQRAACNKLYNDEIDAAYSALDKASKIEAGVDLSNLQMTKQSLHDFLCTELELEDIRNSDDIFLLGLDSLQIINLVRAINSTRPNRPIDLKLVYDHPSIDDLAQALHAAPPQQVYSDPYDSDDEEVQADWLSMDNMFKNITGHWSAKDRKRRKARKPRISALRSSNDGPVIQPDGGQEAWRQIIGSFLININNWGLINSFGVFQAYYETTLLRDHSSSAIAWIGTLQGALILLVGVVSGPLFDTGYFGFLIVVAGIALAFALMMLSLCTMYWQVMLAQGVLIGISSGLLYIPSVAMVPAYFKHHRGLAIGLATGGGSIGGIIYPIAFRRLLSSLGFPWAVRVIGFIALGTLAIAAVIMNPLGPRARRQLVSLGALKDTSYVFFMISAFFIFCALLVPFFLCTTFAINEAHTDMNLGFYLLAVLNACQLVGRLAAGWFSDYHHRILGSEALLLLAEFSAGILGFGWIGVHTLGGYVPWLIVYGFVSGLATTLPAIVLPNISPNLAVYGTRLGMLYACGGVGILISVPVASAANESTRSFLGAQVWVGACCIAGVICFSATARRARKRRLLYESGKPPKRIRIPGVSRGASDETNREIWIEKVVEEEEVSRQSSQR